MKRKIINDIRNEIYDFIFEKTKNSDIVNNKNNRLSILYNIDSLLREKCQENKLYEYKVVVDETNNTPEIIDNNCIAIDVWIKTERIDEIVEIPFIVSKKGSLQFQDDDEDDSQFEDDFEEYKNK